MDCDVALERDGHRHEDGAGDCDWDEGIEQIGEEEDVDRGGEIEASAKRLQNAGH